MLNKAETVLGTSHQSDMTRVRHDQRQWTKNAPTTSKLEGCHRGELLLILSWTRTAGVSSFHVLLFAKSSVSAPKNWNHNPSKILVPYRVAQ